MPIRVFLVGGSDKHKDELASYGEEFGFEIVGHVRYRSRIPFPPKKGTYDKVASMVVYQSHQLSKFAAELAKKSGVPLVILAFGSKMNAMRIAGIDVNKSDEVALNAPTDLSQADAIKYLGFPYHKCLTILRSSLVISRQVSNKIMYDKRSLDNAVEALTNDQNLFRSLPEPYPRKKALETQQQDISEELEETEEPQVVAAPVPVPVPAPAPVVDKPTKTPYLLFQQVVGTDTYKLVPSFDTSLLRGSTEASDLAATIELAADINELPNKTVLLLVQPIIKSEVLRQVTLKQLPV